MPLFLSAEELRLLSGDAAAVAERAEAFVRDLARERDTLRAELDAASIAAEQTSSILEQRYATLSADVSRLQSENAQLSAAAESRLSDLAAAQAEKHELHLKAIGKDGEMERLAVETAELHKSKRQLLELIGQKDMEIQEKNSLIKNYYDKIVDLTDNATSKGSSLHEMEAELARCHATCNRLIQEKELLEKHNSWLNEELTSKSNNLVELRKNCMNAEAELSAKLAEFERQVDESSNTLKRSRERASELELRITSLEEDLRSSKEDASANDERFVAELSTASKLGELYKASSEEWSKKAGELEGVIKALETHLSQVENDYNEKLDVATSIRQGLEKEITNLKEKLRKCEFEIEESRKANELSLVPLSNLDADSSFPEVGDIHDTSHMLVPKLPTGVSGTALAASLLREGWSLAKMYEKYQEAADALQHEKWGRKHAEAILERVLHEIEVKAEIILDERAEHERMVDAYTLLDQKLQQALLEHDNYENTIRKLKSELRRQERVCTSTQKEVDDLQKQVTVLLKECQDVQLRCGAVRPIDTGRTHSANLAHMDDCITANDVIPDHIPTFNDINGLVEQNVKLRSLVHSLSSEEEKRVAELREGFQNDLQKVTDDAASKVEAVLKRSEEQGRMIESLHCSVSMYKRLYEEERKTHVSSVGNGETVHENGKDLMLLFDSSQEVSKKAHEHISERASKLEQDLEKMRNELMPLRSERDKLALEANFARERLTSFMKEFDFQRQEANAVSSRNIEMSNLIIDYQKRLRESSDSLQTSEENLRKLSMEISLIKHEKDILANSEKRASDEVRSMSERLHRLQSAFDTIKSTEEIRENAKAKERKNHEDYLKRIEREWAEAKKELQDERDTVRNLTLEREKVIENSLRQVEEMRKELSGAWQAVASAESRAAVAEARYSDLELKINRSEKVVVGHDHAVLSTNEVNEESWKEEVDRLKEEARSNKEYMLQYKEIAHTNEVAMKQIESAHEQYKAEAEKLKKALEDEVISLKEKICQLERSYISKSEEAVSAVEAREKAVSSMLTETLGLRDEIAKKIEQVKDLETQMSSLTDDLDKEHKRWRTAQDNYERQVILQSETIQELTITSKRLFSVECENLELKQLSETRKAEIEVLKSSWENEKSQQQELRDEAERKYNEINEHNKVLLNQLESLHLSLADRERSSAGFSSLGNDSQANSDIQNVIGYLRRSKEIAETQISLLKQENSRLKSQLETALRASKSAQALLHSQCENSKATLYKDEEFKSLQLQVREINLLRESNMQLREENRHNFEECQKLREEAQSAKIKAENAQKLLREKQFDYDMCLKEIEKQKIEIENLKNRNVELIENCKNIDVQEYERMKSEFQHNQILVKAKETEIQETMSKLSDKHDQILKLEGDLAKCQLELGEQTKKLNYQAEEYLKAEVDRQKRVGNAFAKVPMLQKKIENLTKEKEELIKENQALVKQVEDSKSNTGRKSMSEILSEQATMEKEKDTRIQMLEKTLEREREDLRKEKDDNKKEKTRRQRMEKTMLDLISNVNQGKKKIEEQLANHKHAIAALLEAKALSASQLPSTVILDELTSAYFSSVDSFEEIANSVLNEGLAVQSTPADTPAISTPTPVMGSGRQVPTQPMRLSTSHAKVTEERQKGPNIVKPAPEPRKAARRIVRPSLDRPEEAIIDTEMSIADGSTATEGKTSISHELEYPGDTSLQNQLSSARKRLAPSPASEIKEESAVSDDTNDDVAPPLKKSKDADPLQDSSEGHLIPSSSETLETVQSTLQSVDESCAERPNVVDSKLDHTHTLLNEETVDLAKDEQENISKGEKGDHQTAPQNSTNQDEVQIENANAEDILDEPRAATESLNESVKSEYEREIPVSKDEDDDEKEEGEMLDESEPIQEDDSTAGDETPIGDETGDTAEVSFSDVLNDKTEGNDANEGGEGSDRYTSNNDQISLGTENSSQVSSGAAREGSPSTAPHAVVSEQQSPSRAAGKEESRGGRTITINESAKENSLRRQAGMPSQLPSRARGRAAVVPRSGGRGLRGRRLGRGQASGDREQP